MSTKKIRKISHRSMHTAWQLISSWCFETARLNTVKRVNMTQIGRFIIASVFNQLSRDVHEA